MAKRRIGLPPLIPGQQPPTWFEDRFGFQRHWEGYRWGLSKEALERWRTGHSDVKVSPPERPQWFIDLDRTKRLGTVGHRDYSVRYWNGSLWTGTGILLARVPHWSPAQLKSSVIRLRIVGILLLVLVPVAPFLLRRWGLTTLPATSMIPIVALLSLASAARFAKLRREATDVSVIRPQHGRSYTLRRHGVNAVVTIWVSLSVIACGWLIVTGDTGKLPETAPALRSWSTSAVPFDPEDVGTCWGQAPAMGAVVPISCGRSSSLFKATALVTRASECPTDYVADGRGHYLCLELLPGKTASLDDTSTS